MRIIKYIFIILIIFFLAGAFFLFFQLNAAKDPNNKELRKFVVKKGETIYGISKRLQDEGLITDNFYFRLYIWPKRWEGKEDIKAGTYKLAPSMKLKDIAKILLGMELTFEATLTVPEGFRVTEIAAAFAEFKVKYSLEAEDDQALKKYKKEFVDALQTDFQYDFLANRPREANLEGYLFPDTYRIYLNASAHQLIEKMLKNFDKKLTQDLRQEIKNQNKTIFEIITLASIVQKEVSSEEDMKKVSGVYLNRLAEGMKLESDATITYFTGKKDPQASLSDIAIDSPYNTYLHRGLPKGPISNPGMTAILAAVFPVRHDYLYFITRLDTGEAIFSKDPLQHLENKEKFLPK